MTNSEQVKEEIKALGLQPSAQIIPQPIPVVETNPKLLRRADIVRSTSDTDGSTAGLTIYTTPSDKDFYLTGAHIAQTQDAASTNAFAYIRGFPYGDNTAREFVSLAFQASTAGSYSMVRDFSIPIKLARNSIISYVTSTAVANQAARIGIVGYTVEDNQ